MSPISLFILTLGIVFIPRGMGLALEILALAGIGALGALVSEGLQRLIGKETILTKVYTGILKLVFMAIVIAIIITFIKGLIF
ncbi:hypothetical protein [Halonatronum saccharophilum]|uniref:hypothetical protein n=1 Tax=Halonatronum saccharophilum TaxID=150060 RepID=UPI0004817126|nr:hypothetical protein [Halonatronum saccharophilum]